MDREDEVWLDHADRLGRPHWRRERATANRSEQQGGRLEVRGNGKMGLTIVWRFIADDGDLLSALGNFTTVVVALLTIVAVMHMHSTHCTSCTSPLYPSADLTPRHDT